MRNRLTIITFLLFVTSCGDNPNAKSVGGSEIAQIIDRAEQQFSKMLPKTQSVNATNRIWGLTNLAKLYNNSSNTGGRGTPNDFFREQWDESITGTMANMFKTRIKQDLCALSYLLPLDDGVLNFAPVTTYNITFTQLISNNKAELANVCPLFDVKNLPPTPFELTVLVEDVSMEVDSLFDKHISFKMKDARFDLYYKLSSAFLRFKFLKDSEDDENDVAVFFDYDATTKTTRYELDLYGTVSNREPEKTVQRVYMDEKRDLVRHAITKTYLNDGDEVLGIITRGLADDKNIAMNFISSTKSSSTGFSGACISLKDYVAVVSDSLVCTDEFTGATIVASNVEGNLFGRFIDNLINQITFINFENENDILNKSVPSLFF